MVDWKSLPKIDAHIHLMPEDVIQANQGYSDPFVDYGSVEAYRQRMVKWNIRQAFIMPFNDPYMLSMDFQVETVHNNLRRMVSASDGTLQFFADVDIRREIRETLRELERVLAWKEVPGLKIHPSNTGYPVDGAYYDAIFQFAAASDTLVEIHSYPRAHLPDDACSPSRIRRVLDKYPELRLSIAHLGGFQYEDLMDLPVFCNLSAVLPDLVNRLGTEETNQILRRIGVDRLIFATDFPDSRSLKAEDIYETYFDILGKMDFSQEEAESISMGNALKMLHR